MAVTTTLPSSIHLTIMDFFVNDMGEPGTENQSVFQDISLNTPAINGPNMGTQCPIQFRYVFVLSFLPLTEAARDCHGLPAGFSYLFCI